MNIEKEISKFKKKLHNSIDFASRFLTKNGVDIGFVYLKSITNNDLFAEAVFEPISHFENNVNFQTIKELVQANDVLQVKDEQQALEKILKGGIIIMLSNNKNFLVVDLLSFPSRIPSEPPTSPVIMGPREGFTEDIKTNMTLIRRHFYSEQLVFENVFVGETTKTQVVIAYLDGIADKKIVKQIKHKIKSIKIDGVIDSYYLIAFLSSRPNSILKQVGCAEKPDIISAKMLEGRVAIMVDNSPIVLTIPFVFLEDMQNSNDYYTNYIYSTFLRFIRLIGLLFAVLGPGIYIALQLFHYNVLPIKYLITIADATQQIPFTPFIEILFISLLFQILYEVSLRLPSYLGLATSIVGALILGDTGVKAGLISPPSVIVVAIAKIALYTVPEQSAQINVFQFVFMVIGASLGLLGIIGGSIYLLSYANSVENYGAPYLAPFSPFIFSDNKDGLLRVPISEMDKRPKSFKNANKSRFESNEK
ncbi:MAG: spore germination protein [Candidatus Caccovivens sp.]